MTATVNLSPLPKQRFTDSNGNPLNGGKVFTYAAGSTTKQNSYTDASGATPNPNPVLLDARGEAAVWLDQTLAYKIVVSPANDTDPPTNPYWTIDNIPAANAAYAAFLAQFAGTASANQGAGLGGFNPTLNYAVATIGQRLEEQISPKSFPWLAKFDGVTDDTAAINACMTFAATNKVRVEMPSGVSITSATINQPAGLYVSGAGGGGYTALTGVSSGATIIQSSAPDRAWSVGQGGVLADVQVRPSNYAAITYSLGTYPQSSGNTPFGIVCAQGAMLERVTAIGFSAGGYVPQGATVSLHRCFGFQNATGLLIGGVASATNCTITNGVMTVGGTVTGAFAVGQTLNFIPSQNTATSCTISGGVLTAGGSITGDAYSVGQQLIGAGIPAGVTIASFGTGTGGAGTYNLAIASGTMPTISVAQTIYAVGQHTGVTISSFGTGTGGAGTYNLSVATLTVSGSRTISGMAAATDGWCDKSVLMFSCGGAGVDGSVGNYWRFTGNRIEWNARYGGVSPAEATWSGNIFDRNGWAGLFALDGNWHQTITGNDFSRNGCGGDPIQGVGRWGFSTTTDPSWVPTPAWESCHVKFGFQRRLVLNGNTFRPGKSDALDGAQSPAFIYQFDGASGSTPVTDVRIRANSGDQQDTTPGFNVNAYGGIGAIATGSDVAFAAYFVNGWEVGPNVMQLGAITALPSSPVSSTTRAFSVQKGTCGFIPISVRSATGGASGLIYFSQDATGANKAATVVVGSGTLLSGASAALTSGTAPYDTVTLTLSAAAFVYGIPHSA